MRILLVVLSAAAIAFLAFVAGTYTMFADLGPSRFLDQAYKAGHAFIDQQRRKDNPSPRPPFHRLARTGDRGVVTYDPKRTENGLTLYTSGHDQSAFLISMDGDVLHEWDLPFSAVWNETSPVMSPEADDKIYYRRAHLYPNGDLLVIYVTADTSPWGYGVARMTRDSELVWSYLGQAHHDFDIDTDGKIYILTHEIRHHEFEGYEYLKTPRIDDFIVVLSPEGKELKKIDVTEALITSRYAHLLEQIPWHAEETGDYLHTNAIDVIDDAHAPAFPFGKSGDVLVSLRNLATGIIAVVDLEDEEFVWATPGPWIRQHDPEVLVNGNILLFDNFGDIDQRRTASKVIEFDPVTHGIVWKYAGTTDRLFKSKLRSAQSRLPNGNTLVTESDGGRLFEVTPGKEIVWEYINPIRNGERDEFIPIVSSGERVDPSALDPDFRHALRQQD